jgi:hypothetical protein
MSEFKPGDRVRCINNSGVHGDRGLVLGEIYTVVEERADCLSCKEIVGGWNKQRFELVMSAPAPSYRWAFYYPGSHALLGVCDAIWHNGSLTITPRFPGNDPEGVGLIQVCVDTVENAKTFMKKMGVSRSNLELTERAEPTS